MKTGTAFAAVYQTARGDTVQAADPKREACKQLGHIGGVLRRHASLTAHPDGAYTVQGDGLASLTFEPGEVKT